MEDVLTDIKYVIHYYSLVDRRILTVIIKICFQINYIPWRFMSKDTGIQIPTYLCKCFNIGELV